MNKSVKEFVKICSEILPIHEPIYEFGSLQVEKQVGFADLRPLFPAKKYIGADMREGVGVDVILNLHKIELASDSVGTVLILNTMEHVEFPRIAIEESYRILKPEGMLILTSHFYFPIHDYPYDYWRFTPEGFKSLLKSFPFLFVGFLGHEHMPHTVVGIGFKEDSISSDIRDKFALGFKDWGIKWSK